MAPKRFPTAQDAPLTYPQKLPKRDALTGKQFLGQPTKVGKHPSSFFDPAPHKWVFDGVVYVDKQRYAEVQLEKKKGFLSSDFSRRDEFSKDFATEQYRERLKMEYKHSKKATQNMEQLKETLQATIGEEAYNGGATSPARKKKPLYDLVNDGTSAPAVKNSMRAGRDTNNPTQLSWQRDFGALKLSSHEFGYGVATSTGPASVDELQRSYRIVNERPPKGE